MATSWEGHQILRLIVKERKVVRKGHGKGRLRKKVYRLV